MKKIILNILIGTGILAIALFTETFIEWALALEYKELRFSAGIIAGLLYSDFKLK